MNEKITVLAKRVESRIFLMRGRKVILDSDLALLYGVAVKRLNEQVKRNAERFPDDFIFRITDEDLRSQIATSKSVNGNDKMRRASGRGGRRYRPFAFTEHGAVMAATVLNSERAVSMSILVVRAFVHMREVMATNQKIFAKIRELEERVGDHDEDIHEILSAIREMMKPPARIKRRIGFRLPGA